MVICVTNRKLCSGSFFDTVRRACQKADMIILREKDLPENEYLVLAQQVMKICHEEGRLFCVNKYAAAAKELGARALQLSFADFCTFAVNSERFCKTGASVHSIEEAVEAESLGADFLIAGHIFKTDCKKGVTPRGVGFLSEVTEKVNIPVYGIGGINDANKSLVYESGGSGICIMSGFMRAENN